MWNAKAGVVTPMNNGRQVSRAFHKLSTAPFGVSWMPWTAEEELGGEEEDGTAVKVEKLRVVRRATRVQLEQPITGGETPGTPEAGFASKSTVEAVRNAQHAAARLLGMSSEEVAQYRVSVGWFGRGSSAGLVNALYLIEQASGPFVAEGVRVGVTGSISEDGYVRKVGSTPYKVAAAVHDGLDILIVPYDQYEEAAGLAAESATQVYGVKHLNGAVAVLCQTLAKAERETAVPCRRVRDHALRTVAGYGDPERRWAEKKAGEQRQGRSGGERLIR